MFQKRFAAIAAFLAVGLLALGLSGGPAKAAVDSWSGHTEVLVPFSQALTTPGLPSLIVSAVTARTLNVRALVVTDSASGIITLYNGAGGTGPTILAQFAVIANTPLILTEEQLGQGARTTSGTALYIGGTTGTVTATVRVRQDF